MIKRIGIDLDDTLFDTALKFDYYKEIFCRKNNYSYEEFVSNPNIRYRFYCRYLNNVYKNLSLKQDAREVINNLYADGYKIIFITARDIKKFPILHDLTLNNLSKHKINYSDIYFSNANKVDICKKQKIDLMIDNDLKVLKELYDNNIKILYYNESGKQTEYQSVKEWKDILNYIKQI